MGRLSAFVLATAWLAASHSLAASAAPGVCIESYRIDHSEIPDDGHILFHMRDRSVYQADVQGRCIGLRDDPRGFTYEPIPGNDEICSNLLTIRLNTDHSVCLIGAITQIKPPKH